MQSIATKYIPATNYRGSQIKAITSSGLSKTVSWDDALNVEQNHDNAAVALCHKLKWYGKLVSGSGPKDTGNVYLFILKGNDNVIEIKPE